MTPKVIAEAVTKKPELVVDIHHLPIIGVIAENAECKHARIINFPGVDNTRPLADIFEYNSKQLIKMIR